jgi:integrase
MAISARRTKGGTVYDVRLRDPLGREYSRTFPTKKAAQQFEHTERADRFRGGWIDPRRSSVKFRDVAEEWLVSNPGKKPSTLVRDRSTLDVHLLPDLGDCAVGQITPADVQRLVRLWSSKLAPRSVRRQYAVLRAVLTFAVDTDRITRSPCRRIKLPEVDPVRHRIVAPDELERLADAVGESSAPMVYLAAVLGMRWGECAGLKIGAIDFDSNTIAITSQLTRGHKGAIVDGAPKWQSHRTIAAPQALMDLLSEHLRLRGISAEDADRYVFVAPDGRELHYSNWRQRVWVPALKSAGLEGLTFHALRHANATAMVALSVDIKTAQVRVGHKRASTLLDIYAQATTVGDRKAADELGRHFFGDEDGGQGSRDNGHAG